MLLMARGSPPASAQLAVKRRLMRWLSLVVRVEVLQRQRVALPSGGVECRRGLGQRTGADEIVAAVLEGDGLTEGIGTDNWSVWFRRGRGGGDVGGGDCKRGQSKKRRRSVHTNRTETLCRLMSEVVVMLELVVEVHIVC